jgi:2'-deoxynucleoside 5'-phosphate N-hydrolase
MNVYFGFTVAGDRSAIDTARKVVRLLEQLGHKVLTRHLVEENAWEADRRISGQQVYCRDMAWLEQCDLFIAEVSGSSFGLGFEAGYLLGATNKRVILLYQRELEQRVSLLISGNSHGNCTIVPYATVEEVEKFITENFG